MDEEGKKFIEEARCIAIEADRAREREELKAIYKALKDEYDKIEEKEDKERQRKLDEAKAILRDHILSKR